MISKGEDKYVIWPIYFDKSKSRGGGRKVPIKYAVEKPEIEDIAKVAKSLDLNPILEKNYSHPSRVLRKEGRILIDKRDSKSRLLVKIAKRL
jgi:signal recognition particle subunit SRP19